jgi:hypothetical protein
VNIRKMMARMNMIGFTAAPPGVYRNTDEKVVYTHSENTLIVM